MSKVGLQLQIKFNFILFTNHCVYVTIINLFFAHPVCDFFFKQRHKCMDEYGYDDDIHK